MQKYVIEARQLLALAIPVILAQIAQTAMGFVDTVMAGGYSATDMAAVAIGTSIWLPAILFGHGLLLALTPVIAQLNGSGRRDRIAHQIRQGFWLAGSVSVLIMVVLWNAGYIIRSMHNIDPALADRMVFEVGLTETRPLHTLLSEREFSVFERLAQGANVNDIAQQLALSSKTISTHKARLMQKLKVNSLAELVKYAMEHKLV